MDSPAISIEIGFLTTDGQPIDEPREWSEALVIIAVESNTWEATRLTVNDVGRPLSLRSVGGRVRVVADWPRSNAGGYLLRVEQGATVSTRRISIQPSKLSEGAFEALLVDLESRLPAAVAIGLQQVGGLAGLTILPPAETTVAEEVARLGRAITGTAGRPGLVAVLPELARDPHRMLEIDERWAQTRHARRPHPARLMHAVTSHANMVDGDLPRRVIDQRIQETVEVYENRLVRLYHQQVLQRLIRVQRQLERSQPGPPLDQVKQLRKLLSTSRRRATFLDEVSTTSYLPTTVTMVLLKRPAYRAAFEGYLELHRSIAVRLEDERLDLPLENIPALYQLWGTLISCAVVLHVADAHGYRLEYQRLVHRDVDGAFVKMVPPGQAALQLKHPQHGGVLSLTPEQSYARTSPIRSISFMQKPDITIRVERPGAQTQVLLLDPKYKLDSYADGEPDATGRPKKVDIDKMHAYRDAIRDAHDRRVVSAAYTIYPGPSRLCGDGIGALQGDPSQRSVLERHIAEVLERELAPSPVH